jgi:hypothetical protein
MSQPTRVKDGKKVPVTGQLTVYEGLMAAVCSSPSEKGEYDDEFSIKGGKNSSMEVGGSLGTHGDDSKHQ